MSQLRVTMDAQIAVLAVAEKGSLEAAGKYLGIGKSAVRKRVRSVDSVLGTPVFRSAGNGMVPTDAGNIYLPVARESVRQASLGVDRVRAFVRVQTNDLRIGSTAQSDFSGTYTSAVRLVAVADRPCSSDQGMLEISRFSCMLFLSVRGSSDYARPTVHSRLAWLLCCLPPTRNEVGILIYGLFAAQSPRPPMPLSPLQETPRDVPCKTQGQDGFATSFPVGLLHPL
jgi:DNA-binding transcriptional LysR family regulator